jgi:D-psicose/D-tagatose/L-ribulose 3-epimerase
MRLGASTFIWASPFGDDDLGLFEHVAGLGFDVLEICIENPARIDPQRVAEAAAAAGVGVNVCGATGKARLLPPDARRAQWDWAVSGLREVAGYAAERGVGLAIEPLNRFETDLVNTVAQGVELCEAIGRDNVGLLLDTFHMNLEEKRIGEALRHGAARLFEVHACENDRGTPGSGHVEWDEVFDTLVDVGFDGLVAIESFTPEIEEIARAVSMWRPVASSGDDLARDGLEFLRSALEARGAVRA